MIGKVLLFPFWIVKKIFDSGFGVIRLIIGTVTGIFRFVFSRMLGTALGAIIGFLLGRKHVGMK
jgi:hypothetical protein